MQELWKWLLLKTTQAVCFLILSLSIQLTVALAQSPPQPLDLSPTPTPPQRPGFFQSLNPDLRVEVNFIGNKTFLDENGGDIDDDIEVGDGGGIDSGNGDGINNGSVGDSDVGGGGDIDDDDEKRKAEEDDDDFITRNRFTLKEVELGLQAAVDPYARADVFFSGEGLLGDESSVELEEGFLTLLRLPLGAQVKIGKFRSSFGEINDGDPDDEFPFADRPLVINNFFGEEGDLETGINSNFRIPNSWDIPMLLWFGVYNGDNDVAFHGGEARKPVLFSRYEFFKEIGDATGFEMGFSFITGHHDAGGELRTTMENMHFELEWRDPLYSQYKSFIVLGELYLSQREQPNDNTENSLGLYALAEYQLSRRWFLMGRYDYSQLPDDRDSDEWAVSGAVTFQPSRFSRFRAQYLHVDSNFEEPRDELFFQVLFIIGFERPDVF